MILNLIKKLEICASGQISVRIVTVTSLLIIIPSYISGSGQVLHSLQSRGHHTWRKIFLFGEEIFRFPRSLYEMQRTVQPQYQLPAQETEQLHSQGKQVWCPQMMTELGRSWTPGGLGWRSSSRASPPLSHCRLSCWSSSTSRMSGSTKTIYHQETNQEYQHPEHLLINIYRRFWDGSLPSIDWL